MATGSFDDLIERVAALIARANGATLSSLQQPVPEVAFVWFTEALQHSALSRTPGKVSDGERAVKQKRVCRSIEVVHFCSK